MLRAWARGAVLRALLRVVHACAWAHDCAHRQALTNLDGPHAGRLVCAIMRAKHVCMLGIPCMSSHEPRHVCGLIKVYVFIIIRTCAAFLETTRHEVREEVKSSAISPTKDKGQRTKGIHVAETSVELLGSMASIALLLA